MTLYTYLKNDHEKVSDLFKEIINAKDGKKRKELFVLLKEELTLHADAEHATFYKELKKYSETKDLIKHADKEHAEVKVFLTSFDTLKEESIQWMVLLGELKHSVEHHVKEEETKLFKEAKKVLSKEREQHLLNDIEAFKKTYSEKT